MAQYLVYVWILKSGFININAHVSALIVCEIEEEHLETSACILPGQNKVNTADVTFYGKGGQNMQQTFFGSTPKQNEKHNTGLSKNMDGI
jgi:hypothetical protein